MKRERTLKDKLTFEGVGIHTGKRSKIILHPEEEGKGVAFFKDRYLSSTEAVITFTGN